MGIPKSVTKVSRDGSVTFTSNVNAVEYTLKELTRGALRDVGKYLRKQYRMNFYAKFKKNSGLVGKGTSYWARAKETDLQIGIGRKNVGFWGGFFETGTSKTPKLNILRNTVYDNIPTIIEIESKYLSELNKDKPSLNGLSEGDYIEE